jgi:hypothetical protein
MAEANRVAALKYNGSDIWTNAHESAYATSVEK